MVGVLLATLAYFATPIVALQLLPILLIAYSFYKMAKFLVPVNVISSATPASTPSGYHSVTPYLVVDGGSRLMNFMKVAFDAEELASFKDPEGRVEHAEMRIGDSVLMLTDSSTVGFNPVPSQLYVYVNDVDRVYNRALEADGTSVQKPTKQVYGDRTASVRDPTGNIWWIATRVEEVSDEETVRRNEELRGKSPQG